MANWKKLSTNKLAPPALQKILLGVEKTNAAFKTALRVTQAKLHIAKVFARIAAANPVEAALRTALQEIEDFLTGLAANTAAHAIMIPIQKQYTGIDFLESFDRFSLESVFDKVANEGSYTRDVLRTNTPATISFINHATNATGGNHGYWRTFMLSLYDTGDAARPLFPPNYAVAGVSVIMGANSLSLLMPLMDIFNQLLFMGTRGSLSSRILPMPRNLRGLVIPMPDKQELGVQLDWDPIPLVILRPGFTSEQFQVKNILVIRSVDPNLRQRFGWAQNFDFIPSVLTDADPTVKDWEIDPDAETQVIAQLKNTGFVFRYVDRVPLKEGRAYYYALAVIYTLGGVLQPVSNLSNVETIYYNGRARPSSRGEPPDWFMTPTAVQLFPVLYSIIGEAKIFISKMLARTTSNNGVVNLILQLIAQVDLLLIEARRISFLLNQLANRIKLLSTMETAGVRTTNIEVPAGGIQAWGAELARRLADESDPSRPPYDHNELCAGFIIVAGAPRLPELRAFRELLSLFFGDDKPTSLREVLEILDVDTRTGRGANGVGRRPGAGSAVYDPTYDGTGPGYGRFDASLQPTVANVVDAQVPSKVPPVFDASLKKSTRADGC